MDKEVLLRRRDCRITNILWPQVYEALPKFREDRAANAISDDLLIHLPMTESTIINNQEAGPFWTPRHLLSSIYLNLLEKFSTTPMTGCLHPLPLIPVDFTRFQPPKPFTTPQFPPMQLLDTTFYSLSERVLGNLIHRVETGFADPILKESG